ncbi:DUF3995 domain-containing protein [bacterium]|nr:DUF3995 domain-containing protein [bacterium]
MIWFLLWALALLHIYWAQGGLWPGRTRHELASMVIGDRPLPGSLACWTVATLLIGGPWFFPRTSAVVFGLRGGLGFFESSWRPAIRGTPYQRLSLWIYSPVSLLLGFLLWP